MSVFTSRVTSTIPIPHDEGQTVTIRQLAPRHLEAAAKEQQRKSMEDLRAMGGPTFLKELQGLTPGTVESAVTSDPLLLFDRITLLQKGVVAWSYDAKLDAETFEDLNDQTALVIATAILKLSKPALFQTAGDAEISQKNG